MRHHALQADKAARASAVILFHEQLLGRRQADDLLQQLYKAMDKEHKTKVTANIAESNVLCHELEMTCLKLLDASGGVQLPSMYQFEGRYKHCERNFQVTATGLLMLAACVLWPSRCACLPEPHLRRQPDLLLG